MPSTGARGWDPQVMMRLLSTERMSTYLNACDGHLDEAFVLYQHNLDIAASIQRMTGMVEVVTRNSIDNSLANYAAQRDGIADWFDLPVLDSKAQEDIRAAKKRMRHTGRKVCHGSIAAELSFGFWRFMTSRRYYASLWVPAVHRAFPYGDSDLRVRQQQVSAVLADINHVRNRAAHLEPVFRRDLDADFRRACLLMEWIDPNARAWLEENIQMTK